MVQNLCYDKYINNKIMMLSSLSADYWGNRCQACSSLRHKCPESGKHSMEVAMEIHIQSKIDLPKFARTEQIQMQFD